METVKGYAAHESQTLEQRYDLASVGRYKINKKLGLDVSEDSPTLTDEDIVRTMRYILALNNGQEGFSVENV